MLESQRICDQNWDRSEIFFREPIAKIVLDFPSSYPLIIGEETSGKPRRGADFGSVSCASTTKSL